MRTNKLRQYSTGFTIVAGVARVSQCASALFEKQLWRHDVTTKHSPRDRKYYTDNEIADMLGISLGRLRNKLSAGHPLPPRIQLPGCRNRLWACNAVHEWLEQFTIAMSSSEQGRQLKRRG